MAYKGKYKPKNPQKYKGDPTNIVWRSSWELVLMKHLDNHPDVLEWASEEFAIPYISPIDGKEHRYFPDFWVKKIGKNGKLSVLVIEVKPESQSHEPTVKTTKKTNKPTKGYMRECVTWSINEAKWEYAKKFCENRNWKFIVMNEKSLGLKK